MLERTDDIGLLLWKHLSGDLSTEEQLVINAWANRSEVNRELLQELDNSPVLRRELRDFDQLMDWFGRSLDEKFEKAMHGRVVQMPAGGKKRTLARWMTAASILLIISTAAYFILFKKAETETASNPVLVASDVPPGTYKAKLTLDNGTTIILDSAKTGELVREGNAIIINEDGQLVYAAQERSSAAVHYNTLSTGRGETYPTVLSDGSKVWLNNETSIRYPVTFAGPERKIELKGGEAYFDIAHDASKPFKVILNGIEVEVLGTQFGISAFPGEDRVKTSLITGKVKISSAAAGSKILAPGQAANVDGNGTITIEKDANVEGSIAWVHGYFHFEEADMAAVLRQLARWYDVDVVYHGKISNEKLQGDVERNIPLSKVLSNLEIIGKVRFKIEGRTIIVNP